MTGVETDESVAVVGMALRFPDGLDGPDGFWSFLLEARSAVADLPNGRWDAYPAAGPAGSRAVRRAAYLRDAGGFDAEFFGITPREATQMDPQQRLTLEVAWEALENAGIPPRSLAGGSGGVIMGVAGSEYGQLLLGNAARIGPWSSIGAS